MEQPWNSRGRTSTARLLLHRATNGHRVTGPQMGFSPTGLLFYLGILGVTAGITSAVVLHKMSAHRYTAETAARTRMAEPWPESDSSHDRSLTRVMTGARLES